MTEIRHQQQVTLQPRKTFERAANSAEGYVRDQSPGLGRMQVHAHGSKCLQPVEVFWLSLAN